MRRSYFKSKAYKPMKRTRLRVKGHSETSEIKEEIQATVRKIVIIRDGGCVLRKFPEAGQCGGYRNDGELILQGEHLMTRSNSSTFGDTRNIVCLCRYHHITFKPQYSGIYWDLIRRHLGETKWQWLKLIEADRSPHKVDMKLQLLAVKKEYEEIKKKNGIEN